MAGSPTWTVVADANRYFAGEEPWAKRKTDFKRMETILYVTAEVVRQVAILAQPATPDGSGKLLDGLSQGLEERDFKALGEAGRLKPGTVIPNTSVAAIQPTIDVCIPMRVYGMASSRCHSR